MSTKTPQLPIPPEAVQVILEMRSRLHSDPAFRRSDEFRAFAKGGYAKYILDPEYVEAWAALPPFITSPGTAP